MQMSPTSLTSALLLPTPAPRARPQAAAMEAQHKQQLQAEAARAAVAPTLAQIEEVPAHRSPPGG